MEIAIRLPGGTWELRPTQPYEREAQLQELLGAHPHLIPLHQLGDEVLAPRVALREVPLRPAGSLDLLAVDEAGNLTLVECKLDANVESKRTVIGQIVEYASALWRMAYDDLDRLVSERAGSSLAKLMELALADDDDWSPQDFREAVERHLKAGDFRLVVAVDQVNDRLRSMVEYLNEAGPSAMKLHLLEMRYFTSGETQVLIPQLHGSSPPTVSRRGRVNARMDGDAFLTGCDDHGRSFFSALLSASEAADIGIEWLRTGFRLKPEGASVTILRGHPASVARGQRLVFLVSKWKERLPHDVLEMMMQKLSELPDAAQRFQNKKVVLNSIDDRFGPKQARLIVETLVEVSKALRAEDSDH